MKIWPRDTILIKGDQEIPSSLRMTKKRYYPHYRMKKIWPRDTILLRVKKILPRDTILIKGDENMTKRYYPH